MRIGPFSFLVLVLVASGGKPARADIPPADTCTSPGQPCQNAGAINGPGKPGTCVEATCTKSLFHDGGLTTMTYACHRCEASDAGTAAAGGTGGAAPGVAGAGGTAGAAGATAAGGATGSAGKPGAGSSSGCAMAGSPARPATTAVGPSFALLTILLTRRRRRA